MGWEGGRKGEVRVSTIGRLPMMISLIRLKYCTNHSVEHSGMTDYARSDSDALNSISKYRGIDAVIERL